MTATASGTAAGCSGGTSGDITVTASGGTAPYSYSLNGGAAQSSNVFSNLSAGNYTIVTTDANGCTVSNTANVSAAGTIVITATATSNFGGFNISCFGDNNGTASAAAAGGTAPYSFSWSNGQGTQVSTGLTSGVQTVTVTDANGCFGIQTVTLTEPAALS
ncbi:MAG: adhesin, partial [Alphaproteobacteria bacterium]|nr:adhesin [Alphaproteobacteria bacterium]